MSTQATKVCWTCKVEKPIERFGVNTKGRQKGIRGMCKDCQAVKDRQPRNRFSQQRSANRARGLAWEMTIDFYETTISKPCEYCELELNQTGSGLDRIVPELGYIEGNVVPCCSVCNTLRGRMFTMEEMKTVFGPAVRKVKLAREAAGQPGIKCAAYYWRFHKDKVRA